MQLPLSSLVSAGISAWVLRKWMPKLIMIFHFVLFPDAIALSQDLDTIRNIENLLEQKEYSGALDTLNKHLTFSLEKNDAVLLIDKTGEDTAGIVVSFEDLSNRRDNCAMPCLKIYRAADSSQIWDENQTYQMVLSEYQLLNVTDTSSGNVAVYELLPPLRGHLLYLQVDFDDQNSLFYLKEYLPLLCRPQAEGDGRPNSRCLWGGAYTFTAGLSFLLSERYYNNYIDSGFKDGRAFSRYKFCRTTTVFFASLAILSALPEIENRSLLLWPFKELQRVVTFSW